MRSMRCACDVQEGRASLGEEQVGKEAGNHGTMLGLLAENNQAWSTTVNQTRRKLGCQKVDKRLEGRYLYFCQRIADTRNKGPTMLTDRQNEILNAPGIIKHAGQDLEFWLEAELFVQKECAKFGQPNCAIGTSTSMPRGKYAHYEPWNNRMEIFYINDRPAKNIFGSVMHELAHHIFDGLIESLRQKGNYAEVARLSVGGRIHGRGFKQILTALEHENAPQVPHSPWGNAGCRNSSRLSSKDRAQRYSVKVCEKMATATLKKNTAKTATPKTAKKIAAKTPATKIAVKPVIKTASVKIAPTSFKVEITILNHWKSQTPGVVYAPHTFAAFCTAKDAAKAEGKILRNFGLAQRTDVDYTVKVVAAPMPA